MSKLPFMPMFVGDYIADTPELSIEAHGAYCLILFYTWKGRKFLENDDKKMCRILRLGNHKWQKIKKEILPYFDLSDGTWFQQKLSEMLTETKQKSDKNKANGRLGGIAKSLKNKETALANATKNPSILELESELESDKKEIYKERFGDFWEQYPRKVNKAKSFKAYLKAIQKFTHQEILHGLMKYNFNPDRQMIPHASTWLNGERWNDEPTDYTTNSNQSSNAAEAYRDFVSGRETVS
jgi:uncharacterized protein YdaU (DUF1376 family)